MHQYLATPENIPSKICRVAIIGASRMRVAKVVSLLRNKEQGMNTVSTTLSSTSAHTTTPIVSAIECEFVEWKKILDGNHISVEYLPCVATFDQYQNTNGEDVRYLVKVEYHGSDGSSTRGSSLAPFFDSVSFHLEYDLPTSNDSNTNDEIILAPKKRNKETQCVEKFIHISSVEFPAISGVVIGCGIEQLEDIQMIETFLRSFHIGNVVRRDDCTIQSITSISSIGISNTSKHRRHKILPVILDYIRPNPGFSNMMEENEAYRNLNEMDRQQVNVTGTLGPGKMVKLIHNLMKLITDSYLSLNRLLHGNESNTTLGEECKSALDNHSTVTTSSPRRFSYDLNNYDSSKSFYACKLCRTILFSEGILENPPHSKAKHNFRSKKISNEYYSKVPCESIFLSVGCEWMGDMIETEGKLSCPKCKSKIGQWNWSGAQCSCGTWVTPGIQIPKSRVDLISPGHVEIISSHDHHVFSSDA